MKIAFDVVLLPPPKITDLCIAQNKKFPRKVDPPIMLDKENIIPHITLFMGVAEENEITVIGKILEPLLTRSLELEIINAEDEDPTNPHYYFSIKKTPELQKLHETILEKLHKYLTTTATSAMFCENGDPSYLNNFELKSCKENFLPHITLWSSNVDYKMFPLKFHASTLALCHLGRGNTCRKILWKKDLQNHYIELNAFIKSKGLATTGGRAKLLIRSGVVKVNGEVDTRNRKKLLPGDKVEVNGKVYVV